MQTGRSQLGVAILGRYMYVVGGNDRFSEVLRSVERYSFDDNEWTVVSPMTVNRASPGLYCFVSNYNVGLRLTIIQIYCSCSISGWIAICCWRWSGEWTELYRKAISIEQIGFLFQTCEVNFYRAQITISSVEVYDPLTDLWRSCIDLPVSRSEAGAVVL